MFLILKQKTWHMTTPSLLYSTSFTKEFCKGFDCSNMRLFYLAYPNCDAVRHELLLLSMLGDN
ncbi:hypothetical protein CTM76_08160 [Photobacterium phosphoreum]|jgi:hypothetical protein|nr:hypothetical protein AYY24_00525 [Photobacterium phosphoreum]OBU39586.1 hypothetical protein AYY25_01875 [Photobacterium phosphoreum]PSU57063.1 hypothetical protein CTM80_18480 [Photobacterium phosphoreum]PSU78046.1 hypothetical protein CTM93_18555 [Photobacterium phosphoreum]PSU78131.1 hypothetical protein CTM76_08160 [Photobacterium phosphoreum]